MSTDATDFLGFVRPHKRFTPATQERLLREDGCRAVINVKEREAMIKAIRPGTVVKVQHAFLLAEPPNKMKPGEARTDFLKVMAEIEKRGGVIKELDTGWTTADIAQRYDMIARATQLITSGGKGIRSASNGAKNRGRPAATWTPEEMARAEQIWFDRRYRNNREAAAQFPKGFTRHRAWRMWGPSGRVPNNPKGVTLSPLKSWTPIPDYPDYEAHRSGQIRNAATGHVLRPRPLPTGYLRIQLGRQREAYLHELILETFVGPRPEGMQGSHKSGIKADCRADNLAWETPSQNNRRKDKHGTATVGERNVQGRKTHCPQGHKYDARNTRRANGKRVCRTCAREHMRRRRAVAKRRAR